MLTPVRPSGERDDRRDAVPDHPDPARRTVCPIWFSDSQAALGDYAEDLPGNLPLVAAPERVAAAVVELVRKELPDNAGAPLAVPA